MINVNFTGYTTYTVDKVTQWDANRKLRITGLSLSVAPVIYFGNKKSITATGVNATRSGGVITCDVPNALLTESYPIYAYVQITENGETKTIETIKIPVTAAKEPDDYVFYDNIPVVTYSSLETEIDRLRAAVGSPLMASTAADMTDQTKIYVYVGSETGYTFGNWYYYDGSAWTSGGVYNSTAFETDKTLSVEDMAADAKKVGDYVDLIADSSNAGLQLYQYSDNRVATPIFSNVDAKNILTKCWLAEDMYECILIGHTVAQYSTDGIEFLTSWGVSREDAILAIEGATNNYLWFYVRRKNNQLLTAADVYFGMSFNAFSQIIANTATINSLINNTDFQIISLLSFSATRLASPIYTTATDAESLSKVWLSNDTNYECILFGNNEKEYEVILPSYVLVGWGGTYEEVADAIKNCSKTYFYMLFRNKADTSANIYPNELWLETYNPTNLQKMVLELNKLTNPNLNGKTFAVLCDSIGTHGNDGKWSNVPEIVVTEDDIGVELSATVTYYDLYSDINHNTGTGTFTGLTIGGITLTDADIGTQITFTPTAEDVGKSLGKVFDWNGNELDVWWKLLAEHYDMTPIPVCWASSSYSSHEESILRLKAAYAWHDSQINKAGIRTPGTMTRIAPDYVILARGCNDMTHSPYDKITSNFFNDVDWAFPANDEVDGGYGLKEAISKTIEKIWSAYPLTKIILCTIPYVRRIDHDNFPTNNDDTNYQQWNNAIRECAEFFGCGLIDFSKDGITHANLLTYAPDYTHPNALGHYMMGQQAIKDMMECR